MAGPNSYIIKWFQILILTKPGTVGAVRRPCTNQSRKERGEGLSLFIICSALWLLLVGRRIVLTGRHIRQGLDEEVAHKTDTSKNTKGSRSSTVLLMRLVTSGN
jgi:hypothetical protein